MNVFPRGGIIQLNTSALSVVVPLKMSNFQLLLVEHAWYDDVALLLVLFKWTNQNIWYVVGVQQVLQTFFESQSSISK